MQFRFRCYRTPDYVDTADPDDDHVIAAAVAAKADFVVSGDRHLLTPATHQSVRIVTPVEALGLIVP